MLFTLTTDKLSLITSEACDVDVVVDYTERNQTTGDVGVAARQLTNITTGTTTDILGAPGSTTDRKVRELTIRNAHATTSVDVTVQFNANGTLYELHADRLYPTEALQWSPGTGFHKLARDKRVSFVGITLNNTSSNSVTLASPISYFQARYLQGDQATRLTYGVFAYFPFSTAISTTGICPALLSNHSGTSRCTYLGVSTVSVTASAQCCVSAGMDGTIITTGTSGGATNNLGFMAGGMVQSADPDVLQTLDLLITTEVGGSSVTLGIGAWLELFEPTN